MRSSWILAGVLSFVVILGAGCEDSSSDDNGGGDLVDSSSFYGSFEGTATTSIGIGGGQGLIMTITSDSNVPISPLAAASYIYFRSSTPTTEYDINTPLGISTRTVSVNGLRITIEQVNAVQTSTTYLDFAADYNSFELEASSAVVDGTVITSVGSFARVP
jgi:hypothetical protein